MSCFWDVLNFLETPELQVVLGNFFGRNYYAFCEFLHKIYSKTSLLAVLRDYALRKSVSILIILIDLKVS